MKKIIIAITAIVAMMTTSTTARAQGWPSNYDGVMLQGFYWDSYADTQWSYLTEQADDIAPYFSLIWVPQSGYCGTGNSMGYLPLYYFNQNSSFGSEQQLRQMISTYKQKGTGIIADVVINHHNNIGAGGSWTDFPKETYKGQTYQMTSTDVCANDDGGATKRWADANGVSLSAHNDSGEGWDGCRDVDHYSSNVQNIVNAYLGYLLNDLGYAGFRYDMVKGYSAGFTGMYNAAAKPQFSVGEYWDGNASTVENWMNGTKVDGAIQSGAFDFAFRYTCRDAVNNNSWSRLMGTTSATKSAYRRYAVTFVENHDTEYRSSTAQQDPIRRDTLALNAWLLANPGTPCVFYKHWQKYKRDIKKMISVRQLMGITNESDFENVTQTAGAAARRVKGTNGELLVVCATTPSSYSAPAGFTKFFEGHHFAYYTNSQSVLSQWPAINSRIDDEEEQGDFTPHTATVYVKANFTPVYFYVWVPTDNNKQLNGAWPGKQQTQTVTIDGEQWYAQTFDIPTADYEFSIIFNQGSGKPQTTDIGHVSSDRYFIATLAGSTINYTDVTKDHLADAISTTIVDRRITDNRIYSLNGTLLGTDATALPHGIYIIAGKKVIK